MNWKVILQTLGTAAVTGAAVAFAGSAQSGGTLKQNGTAAATGAVAAALALLKQSPVGKA